MTFESGFFKNLSNSYVTKKKDQTISVEQYFGKNCS